MEAQVRYLVITPRLRSAMEAQVRYLVITPRLRSAMEAQVCKGAG